ncbi:TnsA endonuclease N terminal [Variovorax sp. HW608]|nr:TnsA endonuclease N terminal [Variovorax sp. HW608]
MVQPYRTVMTKKRLFALIDGGVGCGIGESYCSWIRVRRRLSSPISTIFVSHTPLYRYRSLHLLSTGEERASRIATWLGATEIREQMPMWPGEHEHPLTGWDIDRDAFLPPLRGMLEIAHDLGIKHGVYPGTDIPFVATTDLMIRHGTPPKDRLALWQCKPATQRQSPRSRRVVQRLALEERYAIEAGAFSKIMYSDSLPERFHENLLWLEPLRSEIEAFGRSNQLIDFAHEFMRLANSDSIEVCRIKAAKKTGLDLEYSHTFFRMAAWGGLIDIDLTQPIYMNKMLNRSSEAFRDRLRRELLDA